MADSKDKRAKQEAGILGSPSGEIKDLIVTKTGVIYVRPSRKKK